MKKILLMAALVCFAAMNLTVLTSCSTQDNPAGGGPLIK
jgi:hypothetical protein